MYGSRDRIKLSWTWMWLPLWDLSDVFQCAYLQQGISIVWLFHVYVFFLGGGGKGGVELGIFKDLHLFWLVLSSPKKDQTNLGRS